MSFKNLYWSAGAIAVIGFGAAALSACSSTAHAVGVLKPCPQVLNDNVETLPNSTPDAIPDQYANQPLTIKLNVTAAPSANAACVIFAAQGVARRLNVPVPATEGDDFYVPTGQAQILSDNARLNIDAFVREAVSTYSKKLLRI